MKGHKAHHHAHGGKAHHHEHPRAAHKKGGKVHRSHHGAGGDAPTEGDWAHDEAPHDAYAGANSNVLKEAKERKHGGKAKKHYASGGHVPGLTSATIEGGNWENRPANTSKPGKTNTKTGEVKESNAGGFKKEIGRAHV